MKRIASKIMSIWLSFLLCISTYAQQSGVQQQIVTDGKTNTTVSVPGAMVSAPSASA